MARVSVEDDEGVSATEVDAATRVDADTSLDLGRRAPEPLAVRGAERDKLVASGRLRDQRSFVPSGEAHESMLFSPP